jgi:hypothetical protein
MTVRLSKALRNHILAHGSIKSALHGGKILVYSGSQPTNADDAPTGTLLCTFTDNSGAHTAEVLSTGTVTLTGGASGSVNTVTVNGVNLIPSGAVAFNTSLTQTAADLAAAINNDQSSPEYTASSLGAVVTISAMPGSGAAPNTFVVTASLTTITATFGNMAGGVTAVNGLKFSTPAAGILSKSTTQTWSGTAAATGVAGYARFLPGVADSGLVDTTETYKRLQLDIATSGAALNVASTQFTSGAPNSVTSFTITYPAS